MSGWLGVQIGTYGVYMVTSSLTEQVARNVLWTMTRADENPHSLARATGIPRVTLIRRLKAQSPFTVLELDAIARHLGTTADTFFKAEAA